MGSVEEDDNVISFKGDNKDDRQQTNFNQKNSLESSAEVS